MKRINPYISVLLLLAVLSAAGCTKAFEDYNTNPFGPTEEQMRGDNNNVGSLIENMTSLLAQGQQNDSQEIDQMIGSEYGGCISCIHPWNNQGNYYTYNPRQGWIGRTFSTMMPQIYTNYNKIKSETSGRGPVYAWASILRVFGTLRISDCYGPIPYSKMTGQAYTVAYDDMETLYKQMFTDLDEAIGILQRIVTAGEDLSSIAEFDVVYRGDFNKWVKFANTLKLRMAVRISSVEAELARRMAEDAVSNPVGVMTEAEDAAWSTKNDGMNPYYRDGYVWNGNGDFSVSANIVSYLTGYDDPRLGKLVTESKYNGQRIGVRNGIQQNQASYTKYGTFSKPVFSAEDPLLVMSASEAWFLRAEGALMFDWDMKGTAAALYRRGVEVSMKERGAALEEGYFRDDVSPADYEDPSNSGYNANKPSSISTLFSGTDKTADLERILVQKWIGSFPNGWEAWADFRRTGYPKFFPVVNNLSTDGVTSDRGMRRLPYPQSEYNTNKANVEAAVTMLSGADKASTDLWWAKKD